MNNKEIYPLDSITHPVNDWGPKPNTGAPPCTHTPPPPPQSNGEYHSAKVMSFLSNGEYTEAVSIFPQGASLWQSFSNISPLQLVLVPK